jgi:hypothetical protein
MTESFSDIGLLIAICSSRILNRILGYNPTVASLPWCKIQTLLAQMCGLCSVYIICCTTFDQYLTTNHRYNLRQMSTIKLAHRLTIFVICFCFLHSILFLMFVEIEPSMGCTVYNPTFKKYLSFFYYPVMSNSFPMIVTISWSLLAYRNVRQIVRRQVPIVRRRLDRQLTAMVLARVICAIILGLPFICMTLYQLNLDYSENTDMKSAIVALIGIICNSLLYTNFSVNLDTTWIFTIVDIFLF